MKYFLVVSALLSMSIIAGPGDLPTEMEIRYGKHQADQDCGPQAKRHQKRALRSSIDSDQGSSFLNALDASLLPVTFSEQQGQQTRLPRLSSGDSLLQMDDKDFAPVTATPTATGFSMGGNVASGWSDFFDEVAQSAGVFDLSIPSVAPASTSEIMLPDLFDAPTESTGVLDLSIPSVAPASTEASGSKNFQGLETIAKALETQERAAELKKDHSDLYISKIKVGNSPEFHFPNPKRIDPRCKSFEDFLRKNGYGQFVDAHEIYRKMCVASKRVARRTKQQKAQTVSSSASGAPLQSTGVLDLSIPSVAPASTEASGSTNFQGLETIAKALETQERAAELKKDHPDLFISEVKVGNSPKFYFPNPKRIDLRCKSFEDFLRKNGYGQFVEAHEIYRKMWVESKRVANL